MIRAHLAHIAVCEIDGQIGFRVGKKKEKKKKVTLLTERLALYLCMSQ